MTDPEVLAQTPTAFEWQGKTYQIGVADYEAELFFQARHEAWTRNRIEATAALTAEAVYRGDVDSFARMRAGNLFAFGGPLSLQWLLSDEGFAEYLVILTGKGKKERGGHVLGTQDVRRMKKTDAAAHDRLVKLVLGRDFPNPMAPASSDDRTPPSTTSASSNSCPENPGSWADAKSSAFPPATSVP